MVRFQAAGVTAWIWILDAWIWRPVRRESILHVTLISVGLLLFRPNDTCVRLVVCCHRFSDEHQHIVHDEGGFSDAVVPWMSSRGCSSLQRHTRLVCWQRLLPRSRPRRLDPTKVIVLLYFFLNYMILYAIFVYYHFLPYFNNKYFNNKRTSSQQAWQRARSGRRSTNRDQQRSIALNCYSDPTWPYDIDTWQLWYEFCTV